MTNPNDPMPDFSDVEGGSSSSAPPPATQTYTVKSGDSLSKIAKWPVGKYHIAITLNGAQAGAGDFEVKR